MSIPFPVADPYAPDTPWHLPSRGNASLPDAPGDGPRELPLDVNFYFFLFVYYGLYLVRPVVLLVSCPRRRRRLTPVLSLTRSLPRRPSPSCS